MRSRDRTSARLLAFVEHESSQIMTKGHAGERDVLIWRLLSREGGQIYAYKYISAGAQGEWVMMLQTLLVQFTRQTVPLQRGAWGDEKV